MTQERPDLVICEDDLTGDAVRELIASHVSAMFEQSPPESVHALGLDDLLAPGITLWSAWVGDELAGCGALKELGEGRGEIKSMRVPESWSRRGIGRAILDHIVADAQRRGLTSLWLETGSTPDFVAARTMYERAGFGYCPPFPPYVDDPESVFMSRVVTPWERG